jgi:hypothetical protein
MAAARPFREIGTALVPAATPSDSKVMACAGPERFGNGLGVSFGVAREILKLRGSGRWGDRPLRAWGDGSATRGCCQARRLPRRLPFLGLRRAPHSPNPQLFCLRSPGASIDRSIQSVPYQRTGTRIRAVFAHGSGEIPWPMYAFAASVHGVRARLACQTQEALRRNVGHMFYIGPA